MHVTLSSPPDILCKRIHVEEKMDGIADLIPVVTMQANSDSFVVKTLDRKTLWEIQTPQVIHIDCYLIFFDRFVCFIVSDAWVPHLD